MDMIHRIKILAHDAGNTVKLTVNGIEHDFKVGYEYIVEEFHLGALLNTRGVKVSKLSSTERPVDAPEATARTKAILVAPTATAPVSAAPESPPEPVNPTGTTTSDTLVRGQEPQASAVVEPEAAAEAPADAPEPFVASDAGLSGVTTTQVPPLASQEVAGSPGVEASQNAAVPAAASAVGA